MNERPDELRDAPRDDALREAAETIARQVARDRAASVYWQERELSHGDLSAVEAYLGSLVDSLGVKS